MYPDIIFIEDSEEKWIYGSYGYMDRTNRTIKNEN